MTVQKKVKSKRFIKKIHKTESRMKMEIGTKTKMYIVKAGQWHT